MGHESDQFAHLSKQTEATLVRWLLRLAERYRLARGEPSPVLGRLAAAGYLGGAGPMHGLPLPVALQRHLPSYRMARPGYGPTGLTRFSGDAFVPSAGAGGVPGFRSGGASGGIAARAALRGAPRAGTGAAALAPSRPIPGAREIGPIRVEFPRPPLTVDTGLGHHLIGRRTPARAELGHVNARGDGGAGFMSPLGARLGLSVQRAPLGVRRPRAAVTAGSHPGL